MYHGLEWFGHLVYALVNTRLWLIKMVDRQAVPGMLGGYDSGGAFLKPEVRLFPYAFFIP